MLFRTQGIKLQSAQGNWSQRLHYSADKGSTGNTVLESAQMSSLLPTGQKESHFQKVPHSRLSRLRQSPWSRPVPGDKGERHLRDPRIELWELGHPPLLGFISAGCSVRVSQMNCQIHKPYPGHRLLIFTDFLNVHELHWVNLYCGCQTPSYA